VKATANAPATAGNALLTHIEDVGELGIPITDQELESCDALAEVQ
jgi:hypothetical protein